MLGDLSTTEGDTVASVRVGAQPADESSRMEGFHLLDGLQNALVQCLRQIREDGDIRVESVGRINFATKVPPGVQKIAYELEITKAKPYENSTFVHANGRVLCDEVVVCEVTDIFVIVSYEDE